MTRYRVGWSVRRAARGVALSAALAFAAGCSLNSGPDDKPTQAVISTEGSAPNALKLIISTDFFEQFNTSTREYIPVLVTSDTVEVSLPYNRTVNLGPLASVYVELLQPQVETATVRMRVDLDNGEGYDQRATLSNRASLIYYFVFTEYVF